MHPHGLDDPALTAALAMAMGIVAQGVARHIKVPGIVLLLLAGVLLGPDGANVIRPGSLGQGLPKLVGFAVAIILFEGGLQLDLARLRRQNKPIRRLVTIGAVVTALGGAAAAHYALGWDVRLSLLFGTLVIVTGPTVINPLLHRIRLRHSLATILEAEGIFIDAVGATIAMVALEVALSPSADALGEGAVGIVLRLAAGVGLGLLGGGLLSLLLRWRGVVPAGLENVLGLGFAVAIFHISNSLLPESGISAVIVAGVVMGNAKSHALEGLVAFKEQLTVAFIATLFVLLSADVRVEEVLALGWPGVLTVVALMLIVRPISVAISTIGTDLDIRDKAFLSWLAPRGIIAAAVASLFANELELAGIEGGQQMRALVFLVIAATVTIQGLSGGLVASFLGVRRPPRTGYVILGANAVARRIASHLVSAKEDVVLVDANAEQCRIAQETGIHAICGNGLEDRTLTLAHAEGRAAAIALTENETVNFMFARRMAQIYPDTPNYVALETGESGVTRAMVEKFGAKLLLGRAAHLHDWCRQLENGAVIEERWKFTASAPMPLDLHGTPAGSLLALVGFRHGHAFVVSDGVTVRQGDEIELLLEASEADASRAWLASAGWVACTGPVPA